MPDWSICNGEAPSIILSGHAPVQVNSSQAHTASQWQELRTRLGYNLNYAIGLPRNAGDAPGSYPQGYYGLAPASTARPWKSEVVRAKGAATVNIGPLLCMWEVYLVRYLPLLKPNLALPQKLYKLPYRKLLGKL